MVYLDEHLLKYPLMQIDDILKLHLQGILGPAHLISNKNAILTNITNEYNSIKDTDCINELIEEISDKYIRIYIKPYFDIYNSFDNLIEAFYLSSLIKEDVSFFIETVKEKNIKNSKVLTRLYCR